MVFLIMKVGLSHTLSMPACFISFISAFSQIQLSKSRYAYVQSGKTEAVTPISSTHEETERGALLSRCFPVDTVLI